MSTRKWWYINMSSYTRDDHDGTHHCVMGKITTAAKNATLLIFIVITVILVSMSSSRSVDLGFEFILLCSRFFQCRFDSCFPSDFRDRVGYLLELSKIENVLIEGFSK